MICRSGDLTVIPDAPRRLENWSGKVAFTPQHLYRPRTRAEIVEIVHAAERDGRRLKAIGSMWSFTPNMVSTGIIDLAEIAGVIPSERVLAGLPLSRQMHVQRDRGLLVHVRAGTKVCQLNRILHGLPEGPCGGADERSLTCSDGARALATLGGSGGQAIAGVVSTSVHGGDVRRPPIADSVVAIHIVGPGGQEHWIQRPDLTTGTAEQVARLLHERAAADPAVEAEICRDVRVTTDADTFDAALVSVGRFGVIYSLVVEVVPCFRLAEWRTTTVWADVQRELYPPRFETFTTGLHFLGVVINPFRHSDGYTCRIVKRELVEDDRPNNVSAGFSPLTYVCRQPDVQSLAALYLVPASAALTAAIVTAEALVRAAAGPFADLILPFVTGALIIAKATLDGLIGWLLSAAGMTTSELVPRIADVLYGLGLRDVFADLMSGLFDSSFGPIAHDDALVNVGWKLMDTYDYGGRDNCQRVEAMELVFDMAASDGSGRPQFIAFIDEVLDIVADLSARNIPIATILSLRFTNRTRALLGMQSGTHTCHIEIPLLQHFAGNTEAIARIQQAAIRHGARPHWGQDMRHYRGEDIDRLYGARLQTWQHVLAELVRAGEGASANTFSNQFTQRYHLEPEPPRELGTCVVSLLESL